MSLKTLFDQLIKTKSHELNELIKLIDANDNKLYEDVLKKNKISFQKLKPCAKQETGCEENPNMINCSCGVKILKSNFTKHEKTIRHQNFLKGVSSVLESSNLDL